MDTQLTNQSYVDKMEKEYQKLLENGDAGKEKLTDEQIDEIANTLNKAGSEDPMLNMISNLPSNGGKKDAGYDGKLDTVTEDVTVRINPETGERLIIGTAEEKSKEDQQFITDTFDELWKQAEKAGTTDINKISIPDNLIIDHAKDQFNLSGMDINIFLDVVKRYRENGGDLPNLYSKLPASVKRIVDAGAMEHPSIINNISFKDVMVAKNKLSKIILDSFISDITMNKAVVDFNTEMNKLFSDANSTIKDVYFESIENKLKQINALIEKVKEGDSSEDEKTEKIEKLTKLYKAMNDAIYLEDFLEKLPRIKIKKFDVEKPNRMVNSFEQKYLSSVYTMHSIKLLWKILYREFPDYDNEVVTRFILSFCKYTVNMKPENVFEHAFMYHFVSNIIYLNSTTEVSEIEQVVRDNIKKCLDLIKTQLEDRV